MNILNEKKEVTPIITPSLGYKLRSINWNEDFYFDNPIDKEKINSIPKAIEISKDIFLAIEKSGMQYRETYKWDEYLYFKMTAENIFAATIYYYCKHYPKEYCNLAYIIATVCNPDISILSEMLKRDRETEIFIRGLNECHTLNVGSEFTGIKNELTTYLGRLYTKEFFYLFTEGKYSPNTSQFILLHYFDNVIWQVEQLQKNGFLFLESNIKKENDEESLYDSYDDGIPIKFLINKGRLDFSKIMYESTEKNETNNILFCTMTKEALMRKAIELSKENVKNGGGPFGAVIATKEGEIIATGVNRVTASCDPTAHAEVSAIRAAAAKLGTFNLSGYEIYTSCEPCPMCLGAIYWARLDKMYYGNNKTDAKNIGFDDSFIYDELALKPADRKLPSEVLLHNEAITAFEAWMSKEDKVEY